MFICNFKGLFEAFMLFLRKENYVNYVTNISNMCENLEILASKIKNVAFLKKKSPHVNPLYKRVCGIVWRFTKKFATGYNP